MKGGFEKPNALKEVLGNELYYHLLGWIVVLGIPGLIIISVWLAVTLTQLYRFPGIGWTDQVIVLGLFIVFISLTLVLAVRRVLGLDDD